MGLDGWPQLLEDLASEDNTRAENAGKALLADARRALPLILDALPSVASGARRRLAFLAGEAGVLTRQLERPRLSLQPLLDDDDWKVRRNAAIGLGKLGQDEAAARSILRCLDNETDARVRQSMILAFGHTASSAALADEFDRCAWAEAEHLAAQKVRDTLRARFGAVSEVPADAVLGERAALELWCRSGVADLMAQEAQERQLTSEPLAADRIRLKSPARLSHLLEVRTALYPTLVHSANTADPDALGRQFAASPVAQEMKRLSGPATRYRISLPAQFASAGKREWIERFTTHCAGLQNAATGYEWELIVRRTGKHCLIGARPIAGHDERFAYRKQDRPASLHPTLAAAAARFYMPSPNAVVLDPFCGSGTLLAECALRGAYARLLGWDIDRAAIESARVNLDGLRDLTLTRVDMRSAEPPKDLSLIISNPPYGQRVLDRASARRLHLALDTLAQRALLPGGLLVVFRPPDFPSPARFELLERRRIDAGGLSVDLIVGRKTGADSRPGRGVPARRKTGARKP
ncbi:methyltransferase [Occallatibacter riparius]|uniref:Methyltransferase n=1 Tax=Occallatibacter riparius TaxID=1002689 RepID=A0A9J7BMM5_9BACT|nr:methyltransferase [Occallatibacter riparius]UWZ84132.1 methyltransferase [Occallatibacter riparius]